MGLAKTRRSQRDFDGLRARLLATVDLPLGRKRTSYTEKTVNRVSQYVYEAGKNIYELLAPDGRRYILQATREKLTLISPKRA
jgi:hypothetical protein